MNKHIALVLGTIFSITILLVPFTGAFASSDNSVALPQFVFSLMFQSVSTPTFVDVTNYNAATDTTSSGSSVSLANSVGSYSQINRTGIPVAQNLICIKFSVINPTAHFFDDITIEPYINGSPAHLYGTYTLSDSNNQIDYYMFFYIGEDSHRVKDGSGQDITPWGIRITTNAVRDYSWSYSSSSTSFYYYNYTLQSQTVDPGEAAELALDIINVLQLSQLSENLGMINTQLDTGNIASMMESMLTYMADIPDILDVLESIDSTDTQIYTAINNFITYYSNYLSLSSMAMPYMYNRIYVYNNDLSYNNYWGWTSTDTFRTIPADKYIHYVMDPSDIDYDSFSYIRIPIRYAYTSTYHVYIWFDNSDNMTNYQYGNEIGYIIGNDSIYIPFHDFLIMPSGYNRIHFLIYTENSIAINVNSAQFLQYYTNTQKSAWYQKILYYLHFLTSGSNNKVPSDVQQTTDDINQSATTVNDFQSNTQQSLDQNLNDVPVVDYQIQDTTGTQYMKAYSEALFNASNGFRIWYMLPLILFVIGMLIRWGVKK